MDVCETAGLRKYFIFNKHVYTLVLTQQSKIIMIKQGLITIVLLLMVLTKGVAQVSNDVRIGTSYVDFTRDSQKGPEFYIEYNSRLNKYLTLSPSIHFAYGTGGREFPYYLFDRSSTGLDVNLFLSAVDSKKTKVKFGLGPSVRYFTGYNVNDFVVADGASIVIEDGYSVPFFHPKRRLSDPNHITVGYSTTIEIDLNLKSGWLVGLRASYQGYSSKDNILSLGVNVGHRF